jgi:hypothetical protein
LLRFFHDEEDEEGSRENLRTETSPSSAAVLPTSELTVDNLQNFDRTTKEESEGQILLCHLHRLPDGVFSCKKSKF